MLLEVESKISKQVRVHTLEEVSEWEQEWLEGSGGPGTNVTEGTKQKHQQLVCWVVIVPDPPPLLLS